MYILKKLNREKRVGTAVESAALQEKGWKLIQEKKPFEKAEMEEIKTSEDEQKPDAEAEPDAEEKSDAEEKPDTEKKTSARSRKKD